MIMKAGRSFWHSEEVLDSDPLLRMLQIFVRPSEIDLEPKIQFRPIAPAAENTWRHLFGPESGLAPFHVRNILDFFDLRLDEGASVDFPWIAGRDLYFYVFEGSITVEGKDFRQAEQGLLTARESTVMVAFLADTNAKISRVGTVGDHPKIPPLWVLRLAGRWLQLWGWCRGR